MNGRCRLCGQVGHLKPYGDNGTYICVYCGLANLAKVELEFDKLLTKLDEISSESDDNQGQFGLKIKG